MNTLFETKILAPLEGEEPIQYCLRAEFPGILNTWKAIAEHLNIDHSASQSAKIAIDRAARGTAQRITAPAPAPRPIPNNNPINNNQNNNNLQAAIVEAIMPYLMQQPVQTLDEVRVMELIKEFSTDENNIIELIKKHSTVKTDYTTININGVENVLSGKQHYIFTSVLKKVAARLHVYLYGPAGTGKTQLAENVATALNLPFYCVSVGNQTTKSDLMGFLTASGTYASTTFRKAFETGGIFLLDEIDAGNANVITCLNAALANGVCSFADGMVKKHEDFICIAAANTFGNGSDRMYVGRNQLDAASLDRFVMIPMDYDTELEAEICPIFAPIFKAARQATRGERVVISTRKMIACSKYMKVNGESIDTTLEEIFYSSYSSEIVNRIKSVI